VEEVAPQLMPQHRQIYFGRKCLQLSSAGIVQVEVAVCVVSQTSHCKGGVTEVRMAA
jgi:hypothetical protein